MRSASPYRIERSTTASVLTGPAITTESRIAPGGSERARESPAILCEVMRQVKVFTTEPCSFCARVKSLLAARGVQFVEVNLSKDPVGRHELAQRTGMLSFPQVIVGDELLGGFDELKAAADSGRLDDLLAA